MLQRGMRLIDASIRRAQPDRPEGRSRLDID